LVIVSASKKLLEQTQHLLIRFGIISQLHPTFSRATNSPSHTKTKYYRLRISGENILKFNSKIGFTVKLKRDALIKLCESTSKFNPNRDIVPNLAKPLKYLRVSLRLRQSECGLERSTYQHYECDDRNPSRDSLSRIIEQFKKRVLALQTIKKRLSSGRLNWNDIKVVRTSLNLSQEELGRLSNLSQSLISQYESKKIGNAKQKPKPKSVETSKAEVIRALLEIIGDMLEKDKLDRIRMLSTQATSDIFWDKIEKIEEIVPPDKYVYDLQIPKTHNFIANDFYVHNSQLLEYISRLAPRGVYASGKATTAAGLTAAAVRDEFGEGRWVLEAGALVLADGGLACVDEIDKMSPQDRSAMHEAMEQQVIHVAKAGITAALSSRCAILAAANPKLGRFHDFAPLSEQIDMPPALLTRFDVIFPISDKPNRDLDAHMAEHIIGAHLGGEIHEFRKAVSDTKKYTKEDEERAISNIKPILTPDFLRKYVAYARRTIFPVMTKEAMNSLVEYYVNLRATEAADGEESVVAITPRQLEALVRLSEASARLRLSNEVTLDDTERSIEIADYYLRKVASEGGVLDIDMLATGTGHSQRGRIAELMEIIKELSRLDKSGSAEEDEVLNEAEAHGLDVEKVKDDINKLTREGRIFKPRSNRIQLA
ncbi:MAG: hypothetical protein KAJ51_11490, partial [Thermoplasmata archaeon]|nr:hypothetical protein [Thermoplasmata archaeon]